MRRLQVFGSDADYYWKMIIRRGYRFQLKTNGHQAEQLSRFAGCCRLVWNKALSLQKEKLSQGEKVLRYVQATAELTKWKRSTLATIAAIIERPRARTTKCL
jgi:transposase